MLLFLAFLLQSSPTCAPVTRLINHGTLWITPMNEPKNDLKTPAHVPLLCPECGIRVTTRSSLTSHLKAQTWYGNPGTKATHPVALALLGPDHLNAKEMQQVRRDQHIRDGCNIFCGPACSYRSQPPKPRGTPKGKKCTTMTTNLKALQVTVAQQAQVLRASMPFPRDVQGPRRPNGQAAIEAAEAKAIQDAFNRARQLERQDRQVRIDRMLIDRAERRARLEQLRTEAADLLVETRKRWGF